MLAASALDIETESARIISSYLRLRHLGKKVADVCEHSGVCRRVGSWSLADRRLVDIDHFVEILDAADLPEFARSLLSTVRHTGNTLIQDLVDKARLAGTGHTCYEHKLACRDPDIYILEVVLLSSTIYKILHIYGLNLKPKGITRSAHYKRIKENLVMFARKDETQIRFYLPNESKIYLKIYSN